MITDAEIRVTGMQSLIDTLGEVQAERFISLIRRKNFDYTKWQRGLFADLTVEELSKQTQQYNELSKH